MSPEPKILTACVLKLEVTNYIFESLKIWRQECFELISVIRVRLVQTTYDREQKKGNSE